MMCGHLGYSDRMKIRNKQRLCATCFAEGGTHVRRERQKPVPNPHSLADLNASAPGEPTA